jgi:threonine/homoserine/homoserine lactone efflux protein
LLRKAIAPVGCLYLCWLGASLILRSGAAVGSGDERPAGFFALFMFQFVNPKGWVMVLTLASVLGPSPTLFLLFTVIPATCLFLWATAGALLMRSLRRKSVRTWFDRVMGALLLVSALFLWIHR